MYRAVPSPGLPLDGTAHGWEALRESRTRRAVPTPTIVVLEGDQTGQELLVDSLRVLAPDVAGFDVQLEHYDLSLAKRRATEP